MITGFSVQNFRSFRDTKNIALAPVTCLVGRNSSGKSSVLHALMILRQSLEFPALGARVPQLNLSGPLLDAGNYEDVVSGHDTSLPLTFIFSIGLRPYSALRVEEERESLVELDVPRPFERQRRAFGWRYLSRYPSIEKMGKRVAATVEIQFLPQQPFGPTLSRVVVDIPRLGKASFVRTVGEQRIQHWRAYFEGLPNQCMEIYFPRAGLFPYLDARYRASIRGAARAKVRQFIELSQLAFSDIAEFLTEAKLVGPFRTPPARRYSFTGFGAVDTGISGQRAIDLLITERLLRKSGEPLRTAVSYWLKRLGLAKTIGMKHLAKRANIFEVLVTGAGGPGTANFADVGFGISQVLPVLVQGFLVRRGGTFVVQQPELHLHPDAQAALADYFLYLASQGINSIVETHSEYLLLRLRRRLAEQWRPAQVGLTNERGEKRKSLDRRDVSVLHVDQQSGVGSIRRFALDDAYQFQNMPAGFMSQAVDDRVALMKALRKHD